MFPEGFKNRLSDQKYIDADALLRALTEPSPVSIRINPRKWGRRPLNSTPVPWAENGFYLDKRPSYTLDPLFHAGCYYPQEASGMFIEKAIRQFTDTSKPMRVLDLCGAPGGKSTIISDMISADSLLVANDVIKSRASILAETLTKWGRGNLIVTQSDPSAFGRLSGYFDVMLVDAPCSGEGMFRTEVAVTEWSESNTLHCSERQRRILSDVWPALSENGILVYSTCTFNPGENEENIKWLCDSRKAVSLSLDISDYKGISEIDFNGIKGYGFYPDKIRGEGFFVSVIRKNNHQETFNFRSRRTKDFKPSTSESGAVRDWTNIPLERYLKWGDDIWGLPCDFDEYDRLLQNLRIIKAGTRICTVKKKDFLPSHELSLSSQLNNKAFPSAEINLEDAVAFLRRYNTRPKIDAMGWNILRYLGINIGWVKNIGPRLNNYYPVDWRIRMEIPPSGEMNLIKWE